MSLVTYSSYANGMSFIDIRNLNRMITINKQKSICKGYKHFSIEMLMEIKQNCINAITSQRDLQDKINELEDENKYLTDCNHELKGQTEIYKNVINENNTIILSQNEQISSLNEQLEMKDNENKKLKSNFKKEKKINISLQKNYKIQKEKTQRLFDERIFKLNTEMFNELFPPKETINNTLNTYANKKRRMGEY